MYDNLVPLSGNMVKSDGTVVNIADILGGTNMGMKVNPCEYPPRSGNMVKSDGTVVNIADVIEQFSPGTGGTMYDVVDVPAYYFENDYLTEKIETIKALMDDAGSEGIAFVVFSDSHASDGNGGNSGKLARKVMDECHIDKAFYLGDAMSSSIQTSEANVIASFQYFNDMVKPIIGQLKQVRGNHDGAWGTSGSVTYAYNLTDEQVFNRIGQKNRLGKPCVFGDGGFYFYMDEDSTKTRFIILNTHDRPHELNDDGTAKYNSMNASIRQVQFDWLKDVLNVDDGWNVLCFCHVPPVANYADSVPSLAMLDDFLAAYRDKKSYSGNYDGQYGFSDILYENLSEPNSTNTTDTSIWLNNGRLGSDFTPRTASTFIVSNFIPCKYGDTVHIKGLTLADNAFSFYSSDRVIMATHNGGFSGVSKANAESYGALKTSEYDGDVLEYTAGYRDGGPMTGAQDIGYIRISGTPTGTVNDVIITVNQQIVETSGSAWDAISIDVDFSAYKGEFISLFTGHMHNDYHYDNTNSTCLINVHTIASDGRISNNSYMTNATYENRALGTIYEQCLDVAIVNKVTRKVNTVRIGAGVDRSFIY